LYLPPFSKEENHVHGKAEKYHINAMITNKPGFSKKDVKKIKL
jgi:hypothetical protein